MKPKINPTMIMTPNSQNGIKYPKAEQAKEMLAKFEDWTLDEEG